MRDLGTVEDIPTYRGLLHGQEVVMRADKMSELQLSEAIGRSKGFGNQLFNLYNAYAMLPEEDFNGTVTYKYNSKSGFLTFAAYAGSPKA